MRYWDSSALVPLVLPEPRSPEIEELFERDPEIVTWWAAAVECASAVARQPRTRGDVGAAWTRLGSLRSQWLEISPTDAMREDAIRLLRAHPLCAADALQLAAALAAAEGRPATLAFVCLDDRLRAAASQEGFSIVDA